MVVDFIIIFFWWIIFLSLGAIFLPVSFKIFHLFYDKGYVFSKIMAIALVSYLIWIFGELKLLQFSSANIWALLVVIAAVNLFIAKSYIAEFINIFKSNYKILIFEEAMFFIALLIFSLIRGYEPRIEGLEKFMDFGFINSILKSEYFPPKDMWMSGSSINYYYFGHLVAAVLTKISGISSYITYNLVIAAVYALTFAAAFSLSSNFIYLAFLKDNKTGLVSLPIGEKKKLFGKKTCVVVGGIISAVILTLAGNFQTVYYYFTHNLSFANYWYPDAVRFIPNTIHDFPIYSFATGYFHELISLPFVLLMIALIFVLFVRDFEINFKDKKTLLLPVFLGLFLGILYMINSADWVIYALFLGLLVFSVNYYWYGISFRVLVKSALFLVISVGASLVFMLPFLLEFEPFIKGVALVKIRSSLFELFILWGFYFFAALSFILSIFRIYAKERKFLVEKKKNTDVYASKINANDVFILAMIIFSAILIILPEIFYARDIYEGGQPRANTMYKLVYQSWMMMGVATGYIFIRLIFWHRKAVSLLWVLVFIAGFGSIIIYPYFAINSYYRNLNGYKGLYGLDWMKDLYPEDYAAIEWINKNISGQPVIVEAVGDDFTYYGRVGANTGLINIVNWASHEWLWRGSYDEAGKRKEEVRLIYESANLDDVSRLLKKYNAEYVFVGSLERTMYANLRELNFNKLGHQVFELGQTKIYKINKN